MMKNLFLASVPDDLYMENNTLVFYSILHFWKFSYSELHGFQFHKSSSVCRLATHHTSRVTYSHSYAIRWQQSTAFLSESLNKTLNRFAPKHWSLVSQERKPSLWVIHLIIHSTDSFKSSFRNKTRVAWRRFIVL